MLSLLAGRVASQSAAPCPGDSSLIGYTTIEAINADQQVELNAIRSGRPPNPPYEFILCPGTNFDASGGPLLPVLSDSTFICGSDGDFQDNCFFVGGVEQVRFEDSTVPNYPLQSVALEGITFSEFSGRAISAFASAITTATVSSTRFLNFPSTENLIQQQFLGGGATEAMKVTVNGGLTQGGVAAGPLFSVVRSTFTLFSHSVDDVQAEVRHG